MADYTYFKRKLTDGSQVTHMELNVVEGAGDNKSIPLMSKSSQQILNMNFKPNEDPDVTFSTREVRPCDSKENVIKSSGNSESNREKKVKSKKKTNSKHRKTTSDFREKVKKSKGKGKKHRKEKSGSKVENREVAKNSAEELQVIEKEISRTTEEISRVTTVEKSSDVQIKEFDQPIAKPRLIKRIQELSFGTTEISTGKKGIGGRGRINPGVSKLLAFPMGRVDILMRTLMPHKAKLSKKGIQEITTLLQIYVVFVLRDTISSNQQLQTVDGKDIRKAIKQHSTLSLVNNMIDYK